MAYTAPVIANSGTTFAQLPALGLQGLLLKLGTANNASPDVLARLRGGSTGLANSLNVYGAMVDRYLAGDPVEIVDFKRRLHDLATVLRVVAQAADEINTLVDANPGTIKNVVDRPANLGPVHAGPKRVFP